MDESILNALMQLFAIGALFSSDTEDLERSRQIVYQYLNHRLNKELTEKYLFAYQKYVRAFFAELQTTEKKRKRLSAKFVKVLKIAERINETLHQQEKVVVLIRLLEYLTYKGKISPDEEDFLATVASTFNIEDSEYQNIKFFALSEFHKIPQKNNLLIITSDPDKEAKDLKGAKILEDPNLDEKLVFLFIPSTEALIFKYFGKLPLRLTSRNIKAKTIYIFDSGAIIRGAKIKTIYQTQIISNFLTSPGQPKVTLLAKDIEFYYPNSDNGLHKFTFSAESGQLIGVLGASGAGKSTLLNILIGKYKPYGGKIYINGYDLHKDKEKLIPFLGYVPQDDLLIEELTVYQNLYYNAKLCFGNLPDEEIAKRVNSTLKDLELYNIRHLKVGNPLNKYISGGQRKRLNIALELIRQPALLFVDEPTSGLSSMDSEIVMHLLKRQAISGRLVFVNIHQPSSDIFKLFDQIIVLDKGGYPVYKGNPLDAIIYFKQVENYVDADVAECPTCGTVHPELILEILEDKVVNEFGKYTQVRKTSPKEWYILYKVNIEKRTRFKIPEKAPLPASDFKQPGKLKQFFVFTARDVKAKLSDIQYILITLLEAPILALILAYLSRKPSSNGEYVFMDNSNLPVFLFMAVVVALFLGLTISAEEIIKDRKILERESFLRLSRFSYLTSKITILFAISAYQMLVFLAISNWILGIKGLTFEFWVILFSTAAAANLLGLIISSTFDSVVAIYITIPLILVPQMLLGGAMINFDDLPNGLRSHKYTPVIADVMLSRWPYEALSVVQFKDNLYEQNFFDLDKQKSDATFISSYLIPELQTLNQKCRYAYKDPRYQSTVNYYLTVLHNETIKLNKLNTGIHFPLTGKLNLNDYNMEIADSLNSFLKMIQAYYNHRSNSINIQLEKRIDSLTELHGREWLVNLKKDNFNDKVSEFVRNRNRIKQIVLYDGELIRKKDPVFMDPYSHIGRAQFFASYKFLGHKKINTLWFNVAVLWLFTVFMFVLLYYDVFRKILPVNRKL